MIEIAVDAHDVALPQIARVHEAVARGADAKPHRRNDVVRLPNQVDHDGVTVDVVPMVQANERHVANLRLDGDRIPPVVAAQGRTSPKADVATRSIQQERIDPKSRAFMALASP